MRLEHLRLLRAIFAPCREWLGELCRITARLLTDAYEIRDSASRHKAGVDPLRSEPSATWSTSTRICTFSSQTGRFSPTVAVALPPVPGTLLAEGRKKLAGYMLRDPMTLEKMTYDASGGTAIYRSKMHLGLKRNFHIMPGAEWLEFLCKHISVRYEHLVTLSAGTRMARTASRQIKLHGSRRRVKSQRLNFRLARKPHGHG